MTVPDGVVAQLQELGMSMYEAKAYLALVAAGEPLNGYEVAKRSGVPRSTVYETLGKLTASGATYEVRTHDDTVTYLPLPPASLIDRLGRRYESTLGALRAALPSIAPPSRVHLIHNLTGREPLLERAGDVVSGARHDLFLSTWPQEGAQLESLVRDADARGVAVTTLTYGENENLPGHAYEHTLSPPAVVLENLGCRLFVVVADRRECVIGGFVDSDAWGIFSDNPAVVMVAVEYVRHDIAMQLVAARFPADEVASFWSTDDDITRLRSDHGFAASALRAGGADGDRPAAARRGGRRRGRSA
ncbi:MAG: TrmB family transcriptional regulator [Pseudonocardia sp.]|uniref:TrmB family transcriptional regulator n=1 Tax=unclassified Pseudonocardia TaxID=2619320 RepID=UPI00086993F2|nr:MULTISPECIES: helix-turn-helix domain-containing protein [unclassified Pseudonocardia]MBN9107589.1 TrmB family transcriptional regulator [Pseudonocardia sp.]ODU22982.1 MAG: transcriptional regulator TrmB [Pseudonocardia sp. SCN 72-51]ODV08440.1 MAG: transcriptional regulator TrmB [Pseudonocardia sp. SCN 73-27]